LLEHLGQLLIDLHHLLVIPHLGIRILIIIFIPLSVLFHSHASRLERVYNPLAEGGIDRRHVIVVVSFDVLLTRLGFVLIFIFLHVFVLVLVIALLLVIVFVIMLVLVLRFVILALSSRSRGRRRLELL
jgi:hypothetical protein